MIEQNNHPELQFENLPDVMTVKEVRTILGVGRPAIYRLVESGQIRCFKIGNDYKIPKSSVLEYIAHSCKGGETV